MKKTLIKVGLVLLLFFISISNIYASEVIKLKECEYSKEFKEWLKLSDKEKEKTVMPAMCKTSYLFSNKMLGNSAVNIPEKYNLAEKGLVNGVKNQYDTNACWTFASLSSIESNLLVKGYGKYDFSEGHMDLATSNNMYSPSRITFNRESNTGGNPVLTQAYLLNQWGPINEDNMDFKTYYQIINKTKTIGVNDIEDKKSKIDVNETVLMMNEQGTCSDKTISEIKNYILANGAINGSLHMSGMFADGYTITDGLLEGPFINGPYYFYDGSSYKYDSVDVKENQAADHAVTIIGWDDTVYPSNFASGHQPTNKGAWIIQNSYGEVTELTDGTKINMGDKGYYYVSYEDINICGYLGGYYDVDLDVPEYAYYYDNLGYVGIGVQTVVDELYLGNVFTKKSDKDEILNKVSFASNESGVAYKVYFADNGSLNNYREIASGKTDHFGYETIKLEEEIKITSEKYSVIVLFSGIKDKYIPISAKLTEPLLSNLNITSGVSFISVDGESWSDTSTQDFNVIIRAYTNTLKTESKPEEKPGEDNVQDDGKVEVEKNEDSIIEDDKNDQSSVNKDPNDNAQVESPKDDTVESPKTGIVSYALIIIGCIGIAILGYYYLAKKNFIKKI